MQGQNAFYSPVFMTIYNHDYRGAIGIRTFRTRYDASGFSAWIYTYLIKWKKMLDAISYVMVFNGDFHNVWNKEQTLFESMSYDKVFWYNFVSDILRLNEFTKEGPAVIKLIYCRTFQNFAANLFTLEWICRQWHSLRYLCGVSVRWSMAIISCIIRNSTWCWLLSEARHDAESCSGEARNTTILWRGSYNGERPVKPYPIRLTNFTLFVLLSPAYATFVSVSVQILSCDMGTFNCAV